MSHQIFAKIHNAEYFGSSQELAKLVASWPPQLRDGRLRGAAPAYEI
jgi:hypothetical protein